MRGTSRARPSGGPRPRGRHARDPLSHRARSQFALPYDPMRLLVLGSGGMLGRAVVRDATRLGHDVVALTHADLDVTDARPCHARSLSCRAPRGRQLRGASRTSTARRPTRGARRRSTATAPATSRAPPRRPARASCTSRPTMSSTAPSASRGSSPTPSRRSGVRPHQARRRARGRRGEPRARDRPHRVVVRRGRAELRRDDAAPRRRARRGDRRHRPARRADVDRPPRAALIEVAEREGDVGLFHASRRGSCSWYEFAVEIFDRRRLRCRVVPTTSERFARPAPRPAYSVLGTEREPAHRPAALAGRPRRLPRRARGTGAATA